MFFLTPSWLKEAQRLSKGVKKFLHHNKDLISEQSMEACQAKRSEYDAAVKAKDQEAVKLLKDPMLATCERAVPGYKTDALRENIEVIIVAIVIALGIRAYFLQPFKIPTASMQPTLNGIVATPMDSADFPNMATRAWEFVWRGRNYTEVKIPDDWGAVRLVQVEQRSKLHFFTVTNFTFADQAGLSKGPLTVYSPVRQLLDPTGASGCLWRDPNDALRIRSFMPSNSADNFVFQVSPGDPSAMRVYPAGTVLASGYVDTGDQLLVDKVSYNFRHPKRGEVFVFSTAGIEGIKSPDAYGSQHYIKRLTGIPGDMLQLRASPTGSGADLYVNGELAKEPGMQRVMKREDNYPGYNLIQSSREYQLPFMPGEMEVRLRSNENSPRVDETDGTILWEQYMAMGDNSPHSADSRMWGPVPEKNLVGPAFTVYWPFKPHWGLIR